MATVTLKLSYKGGRKPFARVRPRLARPLADGRGRKVADAMRFGPGGIVEQRERETEVQGDRATRWPRAQTYPKIPLPSRQLRRTGASDAAWAGRGQNSVTKITDRSVGVGVTGVPRVHQTGAVIKPKRFRNGLPVMRAAIGLRTGRWISVKKLLQGLVIPPRRVGISRRMAREALSTVLREIARRG